MGSRGSSLGARIDVPEGQGLSLQLFGEFRLLSEVGAILPITSMRARSLIAYLAMHPIVSRQRLAFLLWPDSTEGQARTNLRNVLHVVRRSSPEIGRLIEVSQDSLSWRSDSGCTVDVAEFESALVRTGEAARQTAQRLAALRRAADVYRGDLLPECDDEWLIEGRERLHDRYLWVLRELAEEFAGREEYGEATAVGLELVRRDPLNEPNYRLLMDLRAAAGDRAGAARAYHQCVTILEQELGVEPSVETRSVYAAVMDARAAGDPGDRQAAPDGAPAKGAALVGREHQLTALTQCWRGAQNGQARLVLVSGEPGVGKTRLVAEFAARCARGGAIVARARSYPTEGELGYGVIIGWLRGNALADSLRRANRSDRVELARLLPELVDAEPSPAAFDETDRLRLFDAIVRTLTAGGRPVILVADDLQWCDPASLHLIHYLIRTVTEHQVLVAATVRRDDVDSQDLLAAVVDRLQVLERLTEIALPRLTPAQTRDLAHGLAIEVDEAQARLLHEETEGNPLFVVEAIRAGWDGRTEHVDLSPKLKAVITGRFERLSGPARRILGVAATVGRTFTAELAGRAAGLDDLDVAHALDELWRRGIIRGTGDGFDADAYDFSHGKLREVAYEALGPIVQRSHHRAVAEALAASPYIHDTVSGQIAAHYDKAGRPQDAIEWYRAAAMQALRLGAHDEAVRLLERGCTVAAALPEPAGQQRELELLAMLPVALGGVDGYASRRLATIQQRAISIAAVLGVVLEPPMLRSLVMGRLCHDEFDDAAEAADRLIAAARLRGDAGFELEGGYLRGIAAFWAGDLDRAATEFTMVVERFDQNHRGDHVRRFGSDPQAVCQSRLANTLWFLGRNDDARKARDVAIALADKTDESLTKDTTRIFAAILALDLDEPDEFCRVTEHFRDGRRRGGPFAIKAEALLGYVDVLSGRADAGIDRITRAIERCEGANPTPGFLAALHRVLLAAHVTVGDPTTGLATADQVLRLPGTRLWHPETHRRRAGFLAAQGAPATALAGELGTGLDIAQAMGAHGPAGLLRAAQRQLTNQTPPKRF